MAQTQTTEGKNTTTLFKRKKRIGFEPMSCDEEKRNIFVQIESDEVEFMYSKKQEKDIPFLTVVDMETGLESRLWLSGQLRHNMMELKTTNKTLKGMKVEVEYIGKKKVEIEGESVNVNQYRIFELN